SPTWAAARWSRRARCGLFAGVRLRSPTRASAGQAGSDEPFELGASASRAGVLDEPRQNDACVEMGARDLGRAAGVARVVAVDTVDSGQRFVGRRERQEALAARDVRRPAGVLHE